ncbi:MAG: two-component sensor histidine kinase [Desulfobacteraceae bacterium IS3]|nr:MAG: two-component sensor histidine kinase [Desulfobacteraceae bacterium IS3]
MEKNHHYASMKKLILASMILLPLIPFTLTLIIGYSHFTSSIENTTIASMKRIVADHRHMIESFLEERKANLEFVLHSYTFDELSRHEKLHDIFIRLQKQSNAFVDMGVFNEEGVHLAYEGPYKLTGKIYKETDWFVEVLKKGYYISNIYLGFRQVPHFIIAAARESEGRKWVIRATIDSYLFNTMVKKVRIGKTGEAYLLNTEGVFQTDRRSGGNLMDTDPDYKNYPTFSLSFEGEDIDSFILPDTKGDKHLYATTWLKNKRWLLVVRQEKADAFESLRNASYLIIIICLIGGVAIVATAFYLTEKIVKRMSQTDTEKDQLQEQLIRAHRLAELGEMAAGFAHEINNPLQIIKSEQSLIEMNLTEMKEKGILPPSESTDEIADSMNQTKLQIDRCSAITQAILKFGRQSKPVIQDVDLRDFVPEVLNMVAKKASVHGVAVKRNIAENTPMIHGDPGQLQQVLLNLYNNAIDAVVERHGSQGGKLIIKTGRTDKGKVEIAVTDNGAGISPENQKKIFSPFFTTKPVGKGTGLGLSVCYGIIDSMGGTMTVSSEKGVGTTFTIYLPMASISEK